MTTILNELEVLEDYENADYSEVEIDYRWLLQQLEHRRETLQRRGRVQWDAETAEKKCYKLVQSAPYYQTDDTK